MFSKAEFKAKDIIVKGKSVRYYIKSGSRINKTVILHGFMSDATALLPFADALDTKNTIIIPDLPGFGSSMSPTPFLGLKWYADWLDEFMIKTDSTAPSSLIGYSFGAYICLLHNTKYPEHSSMTNILLTPVVKINAVVRFYTHSFRLMAIRARKLAERLYLVQHDLTTWYIHKNNHPNIRSALIERRRAELEYLDQELVLKLFVDFLRIDLLSLASKVKGKVVVVTASKDNVASNKYTRIFATKVKDLTVLVEIRSAGHLVPVEEPTLVASAINGYV